ncbi:MAG TPA: hypothetical protein VGI92_14005 [Gemmatimonadales bacterium]|jgi:hypothetical protein
MLATLLLASTVAAAPADTTARHLTPVSVQVDDHHHQLSVTIGPFHVAAGMAMHDMDMMVMAQQESLVGMFDWPVDRRFHGVRLEVIDAKGDSLPRRLLHHTYMVNFDRRQLVYPIVERTFSFGEETEDMTLPTALGVPMKGGQHMGIVIMWNNETGHDIDGAYVRYTFHLNPRHQWPRPTPILPFFVDSHMVIGRSDTFNVPPGGRVLSTDFTVPVNGHLLALSGHLHDHAVTAQITDAETGKTLVTIHARRDTTGHVLSVSREHPLLWRGGPHFSAGRQYRLVVTYDNPTSDTLTGVMGMVGGIFVPDRMHRWPLVDATNPATRDDIGGLYNSIPTAAPERHGG